MVPLPFGKIRFWSFVAILFFVCMLIGAIRSVANAQTFEMNQTESGYWRVGSTIPVVDSDGQTRLKFVNPPVATQNVPNYSTTGTLVKTGFTLAGARAMFKGGFSVLGRNVMPVLAVYSAGHMLYSDLRQIVQNNPSEYPTLNQLMFVPGYQSDNTSGLVNGGVYQNYNDKSQYITVGSWYLSGGGFYDTTPPPASRSCIVKLGCCTVRTMKNVGLRDNGPVKMYYEEYWQAPISSISYQQPSPRSANDEEITTNFNNANQNSLELASNFKKAMDNNPDKVHFDNPSSLYTELDGAEKARVQEQKAQQVSSLTDLVNHLQQQYDANPTPDNLAKLKQAQADLANAKSEQTYLQQQQEQQQNDDQNLNDPGINDGNAPGPYGEGETDFAGRFQQFFENMKGSALFSLPGILIGSMPSCSGTSAMTINCGRFGTHNFDFANYSAVYSVLKIILLIITGFYCSRILFRGGGG